MAVSRPHLAQLLLIICGIVSLFSSLIAFTWLLCPYKKFTSRPGR
jgi:hypothetical protein